MTDPVLLPTPQNPLASVMFGADRLLTFHPYVLTALYIIITVLVGFNAWQGYSMWKRYQQMPPHERAAMAERLRSFLKPILITFLVVSIAYHTVGRALFPSLFTPIDLGNFTGYVEVVP